MFRNCAYSLVLLNSMNIVQKKKNKCQQTKRDTVHTHTTTSQSRTKSKWQGPTGVHTVALDKHAVVFPRRCPWSCACNDLPRSYTEELSRI